MLLEIQGHRYLKVNEYKHLLKPSSIKADHSETLTDHILLLRCCSIKVSSEKKCSERLPCKTLGG